MKPRFLIFFVIVLLYGCSAKKHLQNGNYDLAIQKSVKKLRKKPDNHKHLNILEDAFNLALKRDTNRINFLRREGRPENWDAIFSLYSQLEYRQNLLRSLRNVPNGIVFVNYHEEIINAKQKAADFFYARGSKLMQKNDRQAARQAYGDFLKVKGYYSNFKDIDEKIGEAKALGTSNVLFQIENQTNMVMPRGFEQELKKISLAELNTQWLNYNTSEQEGLFYDYSILVKMKMIDVSPERVREKEYTKSAEIQDGMQYVLDDNGNVMKDTLGNDMKVPKYKTVECNVVESTQHKSARISGSIEYLDNRTGQLLKTNPIVADAVFEHCAAIAVGNKAALDKETLKKIQSRPLPFPPDAELILQAGETLKNMTKDIIYANKGILN